MDSADNKFRYVACGVALAVLIVVAVVLLRSGGSEDTSSEGNNIDFEERVTVSNEADVMVTVLKDVTDYLCCEDVSLLKLHNSSLTNVLSGVRSRYGRQNFVNIARYYADGALNSYGYSYFGLRFQCSGNDNSGGVDLHFNIERSTMDGVATFKLTGVSVRFID